MRSNSVPGARRALRRRGSGDGEGASEAGKLDYDAPIEGLQAIDRYTIRLKLNFADTELMSNLTISSIGARWRARSSMRTATRRRG